MLPRALHHVLSLLAHVFVFFWGDSNMGVPEGNYPCLIYTESERTCYALWPKYSRIYIYIYIIYVLIILCHLVNRDVFIILLFYIAGLLVTHFLSYYSQPWLIILNPESCETRRECLVRMGSSIIFTLHNQYQCEYKG